VKSNNTFLVVLFAFAAGAAAVWFLREHKQAAVVLAPDDKAREKPQMASGKSSPAQTATEIPSREGTLTVTLRFPADRMSGRMPSDWRLYSDGRIIAGKSASFSGYELACLHDILIQNRGADKTFQLFRNDGRCSTDHNEVEEVRVSLQPGEHMIELACRTVAVNLNYGEDTNDVDRVLGFIPVFPYRFQGKRLQIHSGEQATLTFDVPPPWFGVRQKRLQERGGQVIEDISQIRHLNNRFNEVLHQMREDPVYAILSGIQSTKHPAQSRSSVVVALPDHFGGKREFDADQIRTIVDWFYDSHWDWVPERRLELGAIPLSRDVQLSRLEKGIADFSQALTEVREEVQAFKGIAVRLDQVQKR